MPSSTWYLFIYQIPPRPLYLRAKVRQRLVRLGAVALKKSAYVLPAKPQLLEPLRAVAAETIEGGGEAYIAEAQFVDRHVEKLIVQRAAEEREKEYRALLAEIRKAARRKREDVVKRLRARFDEIRETDFGNAAAARAAAAAIEDLETHIGSVRPASHGKDLTGHTWVTRKGVGVDRIATAWLVRRFIDPKARFRFVESAEVTRRANEIRFDIPNGDFTHDRGRCTFEVVLAASGLRDKTLRYIADIVHDIDLGGRKRRRAESPGVASMIDGIARANVEDTSRLARGGELLDHLYDSLSIK